MQIKKPVFDVTVSAPWPKGVYLCKKLQEAGKAVCYEETAPEEPPPFGFFASEEQEEEKSFLLSIGETARQEGGFCLVEGRKVWRLQEYGQSLSAAAVAAGAPPEKKGFFSSAVLSSRPLDRRPLDFFASQFRSRLLDLRPSFFALPVALPEFASVSASASLPEPSRRFRRTDFRHAGPPPLNLFEDYFLFHPSLRKKKRFQEENSSIHWINLPPGGGEKKEEKAGPPPGFAAGETADASLRPVAAPAGPPAGLLPGSVSAGTFEADCRSASAPPLSEPSEQVAGLPKVGLPEAGLPEVGLPKSRQTLRLDQPSFSLCPPDWLWDSFVFSADFLGGYEEVLPSHFVLISRLLQPWTEDNLLSVFKKGGGEWTVRLRRSFWTDSEGREKLQEAARLRLQEFFQTPFEVRAGSSRQGGGGAGPCGPAVYGGRKSLAYLKKARPGFSTVPEDLMERLRQEKFLAFHFLRA